MAGAAIAPAVQVTIQDAQGNTVTSATTSITVAITSGTGTTGAVLGGTLTQSAVNGVATFANLTVDKAGSGYTLTATATSLTSAISSAFSAACFGCGLALDQFSQIPAGTFQMGSTAGYYTEQPVHSVTISRTFYMQKTEVTQGQWRVVMGSNPSYYSTCGDTCPVEQVSWDDITTFLQRLNAQTPGVTYRLPTEAEWEYAARAGTTGETYGTLDSIAWYNLNSATRTHAAAGKQANAWGLYDMIGNVWEWVNDWWGEYSSASVTDPTGPATGTYRVLRGGAWTNFSNNARAASRINDIPSFRYGPDGGFRLVRTP